MSLDTVARQALIENGFQPDMGDAVEREVAKLHDAPAAGDGAKDQRSLLWSSIDNTTSKDLDQIEVAEQLPDKGIVLRIGIADVDALVPKGSAIDAHAFANATSVYTGVHVYPMLPEELSTGLTSLNEGQSRLVLVIEVELGPDGTVRRHDVYRAVATNHAKLAYEDVGPWLEGRGPEPQKSVENDALEGQLWLQDHAASLLKRVREQAGALEFDTVEATPVAKDGKIGRIGVEVGYEQSMVRAAGLLDAARLSYHHNVESAGLVFKTLRGLFLGEASPKQLTGFIGIAQASGTMAAEGAAALFGFMAMLSINLAILNLLPIPMLDGGHIFIMMLEGLARRDFSLRVKERLLMAGFVLVMTLMVTVIYNDLMRIEWIGKLVPWR